MNLLLDTHAFLWHAEGNLQMSPAASKVIVDPENELFLSTASVWEIAIKAGIGKLTLAAPFETFLSKAIHGYGIKVLPVPLDDCTTYEQLPFPDKQHRDPFDRLLLDQATAEGLLLITADPQLAAYPGPVRHMISRS